MKSIKTKLALFVSCLCVVLILLVWFLTVGLFEPNYTRMIRSELNDQISTITSVLGDKASGELTTDELRQIVGEARGLVQPGVCVDVSDAATLEPVFIIEKIGDSCQLHPAVGMFNDKQHDWNSGTVLYVRGRVAQDGSVNLILPDQQGQNQQVVGKLTESGYVVIASTNLERVDQALSVVSQQLVYITALLLAISVVSALLFARWFTRPVTQLSRAAKRVAAGNYDVRVDLHSTDELGMLAQDFNYMTGEIAKSSQLQRELIANISHDLRTPLTLIRGYAETVRDLNGDDRDKRNADLSIIIDEADRLSVLVNTVMELSKYSSGTEKPTPSRFDLAELTADVLRRYTDRAEKEQFTVQQDGLVEAEVLADPVQISRVLHNLVSNAIPHLAAGGKVTVRLTEQGEMVRAEVIDDGSGIEEKELPFLFDRYYRARSDAGKRGSGLGLSIVKAILVGHGAPFGVQSVVGQGSTFWFALPLAVPPAPPPQQGKHPDKKSEKAKNKNTG
ncbi:MAG: HAMP domain-containing sensor histidine kinase [Pygmaiobacter sp.]|jgi:signal transduction histidine kinase|nr:HAMP domain-containing sensor histidine kinase [Pygmaiobacter sp.]